MKYMSLKTSIPVVMFSILLISGSSNFANADSIPEWVKNVAYWWVQGIISDKDFAQMTNYLIDEKIISPQIIIENEI